MNEKGQYCVNHGETTGGRVSLYDHETGDLIAHIRDYICRVGEAVAFTKGGCIANRVVVNQHLVFAKWMRRKLQQLVRALQAPDANLMEDQVAGLAFDLSRLLRNNAAFARERRQHPQIEREAIRRPVFILVDSLTAAGTRVTVLFLRRPVRVRIRRN